MGLARLKYRLLPDHAFTFDFPCREAGVMDIPVTSFQLNSEIALIFDGNTISKDKMILAGTRIGRLVFGLDGYFDSLSNFSYHSIKNIKFFYFSNGKLPLFTENYRMAADVKIDPSWKRVLEREFEEPYFEELIKFVKHEYQTQTVYPPGKEIFRAFDECHFEDTKVVIIGQDPYHGPGQANGLCFSVRDGVRMPPSLVNIFKEIQDDLGKPIPETGNLERWATQGVLLLNATLTVRASEAGSHQKKGWERFTDAVIKKLSDEKSNIVFLLWGAYAQKKGEVIDGAKHHVLSSAHPSPFSVHNGFFGNKHFSKTNAFLKSKGLKEIDW
jgi:uracil-DNA glycosylase